MTQVKTKEKLVVIYDTFCGWCYGASPVFDALLETDADVEVLHRHLFEGINAPRMSEGKGEQILRTIPQLEALTGQIFGDGFKANIAKSDTEVLRSGLSAQAAALVHRQGPKKEFALRRRLENLHFKDGMSSTDRQMIIDVLIAEGVSPEQAERLGSPELEAEAAKLAQRAKDMMAAVGSRGVPTVVKVIGDDIIQVDHQAFYGRPEAISPDLTNLMPV